MIPAQPQRVGTCLGCWFLGRGQEEGYGKDGRRSRFRRCPHEIVPFNPARDSKSADDFENVGKFFETLSWSARRVEFEAFLEELSDSDRAATVERDYEVCVPLMHVSR